MENKYSQEQIDLLESQAPFNYIDLLEKHALFNYVIITDERKPLMWDNGKPIIYGDILDANSDFKKGTDIAILSVAEYCKAFNVKVEDIMEL